MAKPIQLKLYTRLYAIPMHSEPQMENIRSKYEGKKRTVEMLVK